MKWPESIEQMAGSWPGFPEAEELRQGLGQDVEREELNESKPACLKRKSIKTAPAFGIWKGHEDMADPTEYVQNLRKSRRFE